MTENTPITVAYGDGIGPEIMEATLFILKEAGARISIETVEVGKKLYEMGHSSGISDSTWESLKRTKILFKAPITTPQGGGYKSLNVTMRKALGLYANIRPCVAFSPFVKTNHPNMNLVVVRENEEDLYAGVEYRQTHNSFKTLKLISRIGCEKIIRYAFEYAVKNNRKKVSCFSKDNIMKFTDGIFHKVFDEIAKEYPNIQTDHYIIDIGSAKLANKPDIFDVIVTSNLYGDIISDIVAETSGSVGLAGSANIGEEYAMFEAIHGSAPDITGKSIANPSGLINAAIMMLVHIGQGDVATKIHNAWLRTLEDGMHTSDIYSSDLSVKKLSTKEFAEEVVKRLGQKPTKMKEVFYPENKAADSSAKRIYSVNKSEKKTLVGCDVFLDYIGDVSDLAAKIKDKLSSSELQLQSVSFRGLKIWPAGSMVPPAVGDHFALRFAKSGESKEIKHIAITNLLKDLGDLSLDFVSMEGLYSYDDKLGFSLGQGE